MSSTFRAVAVVMIIAIASACFFIWGAKRTSSPRSGQEKVSLSARYQDALPPGSPLVEPVRYKAITPQSAVEINKAIPLEEIGPRAAPFIVALDTPEGQRAAYCLAQVIYYEARNEPTVGQQAVAQVVLNRVRSRAFPASICRVVFQGSDQATGCQFTFTCDGSLRHEPIGAAWAHARKLAASALSGKVYASIGYATHYHANYVVPYWAASMAKVGVLGLHDFYRWPGRWRAAKYFSQVYSGSEPEIFASADAASLIVSEQDLAATLVLDRPNTPVGTSPAKGEAMLAIDQSSHTLVVQGSQPELDPRLNHWTPLKADLEARFLEPR